MDLKRFRFSTGRILIAITLFALVFAVGHVLESRHQWNERASYHYQLQQADMALSESLKASDPETARKLFDHAKWHMSLASKYARASTYPDVFSPPTETPGTGLCSESFNRRNLDKNPPQADKNPSPRP